MVGRSLVDLIVALVVVGLIVDLYLVLVGQVGDP